MRHLAHLLKTIQVLSQSPWCDQVLREKGVNHSKQEMSIVTWPDKMMFVRLLRGACANGVNHHDFAAALAQTAQSPAHIRSRHQAAIRDQRVRAQQ